MEVGRGFYRRVLPSPPAIDFSSPQGKKLFTEGIHDGTMEGFFKLVPYFQTQSEPAYCGLTTLAMVLNALSVDPCRKWKGRGVAWRLIDVPFYTNIMSLWVFSNPKMKFLFRITGPWRWFDESMLDCCEPLEKIREKGISFEKVVCLAHCAGANVDAFHTNQISIDEFRKYVIACSKSDDRHVISLYNRRAFKQTGTGHFSPIGGYHAESDMVLILDVARFKYPPHWVPLSLLWEAMDTVDQATGLHRGFMVVSRQQRPPAFLYTLSCKHESWINTAKYLTEDVPVLLSSDNVKDIKDVVSTVFSSLPSDFAEFIKWVADVHTKEDGGKSLSQEEKGRLAIKEEVLKRVQETALYKHVTDTLSSEEFLRKIEQNSGQRDCLLNSTATVCCHGAGESGSSNRCYRQVIVDQGVDMGLPLSQTEPSSSCSFDPARNDVFTALLLALPPQTWSVIKNEQVLKEISALVSIQTLPSLLPDEILHLRGQLLLLKRCKDNGVEDDLGAPAI